MLDDGVVISGIDLVDQTPIVSVIPYTLNHSISQDNLRIPKWLEETKGVKVDVSWHPNSEKQLNDLYKTESTEENKE